MSGRKHADASQHLLDRSIRQRIRKVGVAGAKLSGPAICPECGALYDSGRWQWASAQPLEATKILCPACERMRDNSPAGVLVLGGPYFALHREEIMHLVTNKVAQQSAQHPLKRILRIDDSEPQRTVVTFTDAHSPRGVGHAVQHAHKGTLDIHHGEDSVTAEWNR